MTEKLLTSKIVSELRRRIRDGEQLWFLKIHGGPFQRAGVPDLLVIRPEGRACRVCWLEVKSSTGTVSPLQMHTLDQLRQVGCVAEVVRSMDDLRRILEENKP